MKYRARPDMIGRTLRCKCGERLHVTDPDANDAPDQLTDTNADTPFKPSVEDDLVHVEVEEDNRPASPPPTGRISPVMEALINREDEVGMPIFRERILPYVFLSIGLAAQLILWFVWTVSPASAMAVMGIAVSVQVILFAPILLFLLVSVAKWIDLDLGTFFSLCFKVAALTLGPLGVADALLTISLVVTDFDWHVIAAGFGFYVILAGLPIWILFRTNVGETALLLTINYLPRTIAIYIGASILHNQGIIK